MDDLVSSVQVAGTLAALAGLEAEFPHGDLCGALSAEARPEGEEAVFFEHYAAYWGVHPFYGVRTRDWKLVRYFGDGEAGAAELYHLAADPHELINLSGRPEHAGMERRLAAQADAWWRGTGGRDLAYYESEAFRNNEHNAPPRRP